MKLLNNETLDEIKSLAQEVCQREFCQFYDLEFTGGGNRVLRIFVMRQDGSVSFDQCAEVSRGLSWLLDTHDVIPGGSYNLEVSSPGLERRLKEKWHFEGAIKEIVKLNLSRPLDIPRGVDKKVAQQMERAKQLKGPMIEVIDDGVVVESNKLHWKVPFDNIQRAQVVFDFQKTTQKKG